MCLVLPPPSKATSQTLADQHGPAADFLAGTAVRGPHAPLSAERAAARTLGVGGRAGPATCPRVRRAC